MRSRGGKQAWRFRSSLAPLERPFRLAFLGLALFGSGTGCNSGEAADDVARPPKIGRIAEPLVWLGPQRIVAPQPSTVGRFGRSVAIDGDTAAVGAGFEAYAYRLRAGTWELEGELLPVGTTGSFGDSVAVSGGTIAVGGFCDLPGINAGQVVCAHVYVRTGADWNLEQQLLIKDWNYTTDVAGVTVALNGDTLFFGSTLHDAVFVYERSGSAWTQRQVITAPDGGDAGSGTFIGGAVALGTDTAILGRTYGANSDIVRGSAYVFVRSGSWKLQQALVGSGQISGVYGEGVALSGDTAVVSDWAPLSHVHIFRRSGASWSEEQTFSNYFARGPVALDGNMLAFIGGYPGDYRMHLFERQSTWVEAPFQAVTLGSWGPVLSAGSVLVGDATAAVDGHDEAGHVLAFRLANDVEDAGFDVEAGIDAATGTDADAASDAKADTGSVDAAVDDGNVRDRSVDEGHSDAFMDATDVGGRDGGTDASTSSDGMSAGTNGGGSAGEASADGATIPPRGGSGGAAGSGGRSLAPSQISPNDSSGGCGCDLKDARRGQSLVAGLLLVGLVLHRRRRTHRSLGRRIVSARFG